MPARDAAGGATGGQASAASAASAPHRPTSTQWEGQTGDALAARIGTPRVVVHESIASTMDAAHALAADGAPAGTVVLADRQTAGRGRGGASWISPAGS